jgi:2-polyprenyl-6-methoxyphenol hydroxylase-like FAD-dependent oxidoreductase
MTKTVLISGAGIAGATLAWWLARHGFAATVVERADGTRSSGSPVDVEGPSFGIVREMGLLPALREAATQVREMTLIDAAGQPITSLPMAAFTDSNEHIEVPRNDLARLLHEAGRDRAEYIFGDHIAALTQTTSAVEVRFASGAERNFDLVVGADGLHSSVRRLALGPEDQFVKPLGIYVATLPLPGEHLDPSRVLLYNRPSRSLALHPARGLGGVAFIFRAPIAGFDHRDDAQHLDMLERAYADMGWRASEFLAAAKAAPDLYFDAVSRVVIDRWSNGRVTLVGDAASCVSLFGGGTGLAIAGARILADELAAGSDHVAAFASYEAKHRQAVMPRQRGMGLVSGLIVPRTALGIAVRNTGVRLVSLFARRAL